MTKHSQPHSKPAPALPNSADPLAVPELIASKLLEGRTLEITQAQLENTITDVQIQTQVLGSNALTLTIVDPGLDLVQSGIFYCDDEGGLPTVDVTFDGVEYRLVDVQGNLDLTGSNLVLEFQNRGKVELSEKLKGIKVNRDTMTRAEFIQARVQEVKPKVRFICPLLKAQQPIAENTFLPSGNERMEEHLRGLAPQLFKSKKPTKKPAITRKKKKK